LFHNQDEEYRVLLPLTQEGFKKGKKGFHIVDPRHRQERLQRIEQLGIDVRESERPGRMEVRAWEDAHLRRGHFDQYTILALAEEILTAGSWRLRPDPLMGQHGIGIGGISRSL
jgi:hypothetical protein